MESVSESAKLDTEFQMEPAHNLMENSFPEVVCFNLEMTAFELFPKYL